MISSPSWGDHGLPHFGSPKDSAHWNGRGYCRPRHSNKLKPGDAGHTATTLGTVSPHEILPLVKHWRSRHGKHVPSLTNNIQYPQASKPKRDSEYHSCVTRRPFTISQRETLEEQQATLTRQLHCLTSLHPSRNCCLMHLVWKSPSPPRRKQKSHCNQAVKSLHFVVASSFRLKQIQVYAQAVQVVASANQCQLMPGASGRLVRKDQDDRFLSSCGQDGSTPLMFKRMLLSGPSSTN